MSRSIRYQPPSDDRREREPGRLAVPTPEKKEAPPAVEPVREPDWLRFEAE
jgi:hypothetical protein